MAAVAATTFALLISNTHCIVFVWCRQRKVCMVEYVNTSWSVRPLHHAHCRSHRVFTQAGVLETVLPSTALYHCRPVPYSARWMDWLRSGSRCQRNCDLLRNWRAMIAMRRHLLATSWIASLVATLSSHSGQQATARPAESLVWGLVQILICCSYPQLYICSEHPR